MDSKTADATRKYLISYHVHLPSGSEEVEAADMDAADHQVRDRLQAEHPGCVVDTQIRQLSEPWVSGGWYDLHGPADVLVFEASIGNHFQEGDLKLMCSRVEAEGFTVVDSWNGDGASTMSIRAEGRVGAKQLTAEQLSRICAPRCPDLHHSAPSASKGRRKT